MKNRLRGLRWITSALQENKVRLCLASPRRPSKASLEGKDKGVVSSPPRFKKKYRIASSRLKEWDYGTPGYYFITICTQNRRRWFGEVAQDQIGLSTSGEIVKQELFKTTDIRPNVRIDTWVVMPNHIHAIIAIDDNRDVYVETPRRGVSTTRRKWRSGTLGAIINQYKSKCTKRIRAARYTDIAWQSRFYDHIISEENELNNIRAYILDNPIKWVEDEYFINL